MTCVALNPEQERAVTAGLPPHAVSPADLVSPPSLAPVFVDAGAGTGKTATLAARVAALLGRGLPAERLLLLTFSRRAAAEMVRRAGLWLDTSAGRPPPARPCNGLSLPWAGTFHSVAARLLRLHAHDIGLNPDFSVLDRADAVELLAQLREHHLPPAGARRVVRTATCLAILSDCQNLDRPLAEVLAERYPWCAADEALLRALFRDYTLTKARQALLDYDDLLLWLAHALEEPSLAALLRNRFDALLVDECQDCNPLQWRILRALAPQGRGVYLVGDPRQCIYGFRGARHEDLAAYLADVSPMPRPLVRNYRSTQSILDAAHALLAAGDDAPAAPLQAASGLAGARPRLVTVHDDAAQAEYVIAEVLAEREAGVRLRDQAVLFRSAHHSDGLELALARAGIPFVKHGGLKFVEAAHVRDAMAIVRWGLNPAHALAASRALQTVPGIGPAHARRLFAEVRAGGEGFSALASAPAPEQARQPLQGLARVLAGLAAPGNGLAAFDALMAWFAPLLRARDDHAATRLADLDMLAAAIRRLGGLRELLVEFTLEPPQAAGDLGDRAHRDDDFLILSTVHSAKGQEWRNVFVLNVTDGNFPNEYATGDRRALAEERRLLYVAMTRARGNLHLIEPRCHYVTAQQRLGARHVTAARSRFVDARLLHTLQPLAWPQAAAGEAGQTAPGSPSRPAPGASSGAESTAAARSAAASGDPTQPGLPDLAQKLASRWLQAPEDDKILN